MYWRLPIIAALAGFILCATAHATVVTWNFAGNPAQVADGSKYTTTLGDIYVYAKQANNTGVFVTPYKYNNVATESGLFRTNDSHFNNGNGIAPYDPVEGSTNYFAAQDGITDIVPHTPTPGYDNLLLLKLDTNIAVGTTISFLLQAGVSGDQFDIWTQGGTATPTKLGGTGGMVQSNSAHINVDEPGSILSNGSSQPTKPQYSITKTAGVEWVAITADCHYLLLDTITGTSPSTVPEPRFYSLLIAGLLGLAGVYARKRQAPAPNASTV